MTELLTAVFQWTAGFFTEVLNLLLYVPKMLFQGLVDGFIAVFNTVPVCGCITQAGSVFASISPYVWWFASMMEFGFGIGAILCVMLIRFLLRALPWVF